MPKMIFVNLPVADVDKSIAFYAALGGEKDPQFSQDGVCAMMRFSETIHIMLMNHARFSDFTPRPIANAQGTTEVLICLSAESRAEVNQMTEAAGRLGGSIDIAPVQEHGFMYGRSFADPDGHIIETMWMDLEACKTMMQAQGEPA
jgi:predicted lactoylglutathione lyase